MRDYKTICDLCHKQISEIDYLLLKYNRPLPYFKIFKRNPPPKELDVCGECMKKILAFNPTLLTKKKL